MSRPADPVETYDRAIARIARFNPGLNAVLEVREARTEAEASARRVKAGEPRSPIDGLPVAVKANIALSGLAWHAGIAAYRDRIAQRDAACVARLKAAGAVVFATLNMEEGALGAVTDNPHFGRCLNPWGENLTPGGSSGGSGAAVAAGLVPASLGTDTMGSVRIPAAYCGVAGHKPSRGAVPLEGVIALSRTLDHVGPLARKAKEAADVFAVLSETPPARAPGLSGLLIGRWRVEDHVAVDGEILAAFEAALKAMEKRGARIVDISLARYGFGQSRRAGLLIAEREGAAIHAEALEADPEGFSEDFRKMLAWGARQSPDRYEAALLVLKAAAADAGAAFEACDLLAAPTACETAFPFGSEVPAGQADITAFADLAGIPATSVPSALSSAGLPMAIQFMAPAGEDARALGAAMAYEDLRGEFPAPDGFE
ncbi:amidase [Marinicauda algicola]|uniref:Amidase n=1 Tax=Marinicauda algicola TaxID=2029849 RepID=A0A4S2H3M3_9PROT|nr:amidase [Marinicauda algicola]TGY90174.1 amidase [Marinicauda algicola]